MATNDPDKIFERAERLCLVAVNRPSTIPAYKDATASAEALEHTGWKRTTGVTQNDKILKHLRRQGSITVREAMVEYSIQSLTKRIQELRGVGHKIKSNVKFHKVTGQKYVRYTLEDSRFDKQPALLDAFKS